MCLHPREVRVKDIWCLPSGLVFKFDVDGTAQGKSRPVEVRWNFKES